jgi:hypothetical protein
MKTLICGGRNFSDAFFMENFLNNLEIPPSLIISGAQNRLQRHQGQSYRIGADWLAIEYALRNQIPFVGIPAIWVNSKSGFDRNTKMFDDWSPERVIAFPGSNGTLDTINKARARDIPVILAGW